MTELPREAIAAGAFATPGAWTDVVTNGGERYLPLVRSYDASMHLGHMASYRAALRYSHGRRVLDLGCGTGYGSFFLASLAARQVVGCDFSGEALTYAAAAYAHPRLSYARADAVRLPFRDGAFDFVFSSQVIEHLPSPEAMLREIRRVLAPDGLCLVTTPNRVLFSPDGASDNAHHLSEMDLATYRRLADSVFPRVEMRGIPQRCLTLRPGSSTPSAKPNEQIRPEDYQVQCERLDECENLLCLAFKSAAGEVSEDLPVHLRPFADELGPIFWDPRAGRWLVMGLFPFSAPSVPRPLRFGAEARRTIVAPRDGLCRVEVDVVNPKNAPLDLRIQDAEGRVVGRSAAGRAADRLVAAFEPIAGSGGRPYVVVVARRAGVAGLLRAFSPVLLETRAGELVVLTFHADLSH